MAFTLSYISLQATDAPMRSLVGRCRFTVLKPELKARMVSVLETIM